MFDKLFLTVLKWRWTWVIIGAIACGVYVYGLIQTNRELRADNEKRRQNEVALQDSITKKADSIQVLSIRVSDLQSESSEWKNKYVAIRTKYQIVLDTVRVLRGQGHTTTIGDSIGIVSFDTTQGIASLQCTTKVNVKSKESSYSFNLSFADIQTESAVFYDETDKLWKIRTMSLSPGVKLKGISTIDEETFRKIQGLKSIQQTTPSTIGVGGLVTLDRLYGGIIISPSQWSFSIHYKLFNKVGTPNEAWSDKIMIGVHYFLW